MSTSSVTGFVVFAFGILITCVFTHTVDDIRQLVEDKTKNYNKKYRPVYDQGKSMHVAISFELIAIQEFDEVAEKFSVIGFLSMIWHDELLEWKPEDYGNMTGFAAEGGDFWQPRLILTNPHGNLAAVGNDWDIVRYSSGGIVFVSPGAVLDVTCSVDTRKYPWDEQSCSLVFIPWGYLANEVYLVNMTPVVGTTFYEGNGAWDLFNTKTVPYIDAAGSSLVVFMMQLRRKPRFILVNVILPVVFMSFLNMVVFLIPTESGERISYCLTVLLAIAVFFTLVGDNLPKTSDPMSSLSYYLLIILVISVCIIFATVFSLRIYFRDEKRPIPKCLETVVQCLLCNCRKRRNFRHRNKSTDEQSLDFNPSNRDHNRGDNKLYLINSLPRIYQTHGKLNSYKCTERCSSVSGKLMNGRDVAETRSRSHSSYEEGNQVSWKDVSRVLDIIFFIAFLCLMITATVLFFVTAMTKSIFGEKED